MSNQQFGTLATQFGTRQSARACYLVANPVGSVSKPASPADHPSFTIEGKGMCPLQNSINQNEPNDYHAYLLRLWRNSPQQPWRASIYSSVTETPHHFADMSLLFAFLQAQLDGLDEVLINEVLLDEISIDAVLTDEARLEGGANDEPEDAE